MAKMLKIRHKLVDSCHSKMPQMLLPTMPMPTHTAYAVPNGSFFSDKDSKNILAIIAIMVIRLTTGRLNPCEYFKPTAHAISKKPAVIKINQAFIVVPYLGRPKIIVKPAGRPA